MQTETLPSGTILHGRYRIERALGSGGFGHVYLSVDMQANMQYAIKEYLVTGTSGKAQLEHESQVLGRLHHPNLPAFLEAFDELGHYYVVLGYIEGNDLTDYIRVVRQKNEVVPLARLMEWVLSICDAVSFLHRQQPPIIHRDIKPDNIRITASGTAMLVDLGNAKASVDGARTLFFIRHQGTPGYAPLEQYPGGTGTDERSDIYALGGTLYFALTTQEPPSVSARNQSLQQKQTDLPGLAERLAQNPPDSPQEPRQFRLGVSKPSKPAPRHSRHLAQLGTIPPELLHRLDAVIQRAMAMKPKDRYQSVTDFSRDLRMVLQSLPTQPAQPVADSRPVDPHSTQPDLPMLYEAMQNAQAANQPGPSPVVPASANSAPANAGPAPASANAGAVLQQCPRCGAEITRPAPYCPRCGNPLNAQAAQNSAASRAYPPVDISQAPTVRDHSPAARDISDEATMFMPPRTPAQEPNNPNYGSGPAQASARPSAGSPAPAASSTRQSGTPFDASSARPSQSSMYSNVKPFIPAPASAGGNAAPASTPPASAPAATDTQGQNKRRTLLIALAIIVVALIIIMLVLITFLRSRGGGAFHEEWLQYGLHYVQNVV